MSFAKGHIKAGGRAKGTENQTTKETREVLQLIISKELKKLPRYLAAITNPAIKAKLIIDLLPFVIPKLNSIDLTGANDSIEKTPVIINWGGKEIVM